MGFFHWRAKGAKEFAPLMKATLGKTNGAKRAPMESFHWSTIGARPLVFPPGRLASMAQEIRAYETRKLCRRLNVPTQSVAPRAASEPSHCAGASDGYQGRPAATAALIAFPTGSPEPSNPPGGIRKIGAPFRSRRALQWRARIRISSIARPFLF